MKLPLTILPFLKISGLVLHLILLLFLYPLSGIAAEKEVLIGVLAKRGAEHTLQKWQPTADYLSQEIPGYHFTIQPLDFDAISPTVAQGKVDFILANPSFYVELEAGYGAKRIATLRNRLGESISTQFGGVIFSRAERVDINVLEDLVGRSLMAVKESSLGGFHMAWGELQRHDIDPYKDLSSLQFGGSHDAVVYAVLKGEVDAGTVRTDTLERMAQEGLIELADIKVIHHDQPDEKEDSPFLHSTPLYPEWPFASLTATPPELAQTVAIALLRMPPESKAAIAAKCAGWGVPLNYQPVHDLLKSLQIGIYKDFGKISFSDVVRLYLHWLLLGLLLLITMSAVTIYVARLNTRLESSRRALKEARDNLETRVQERTRELQQTSREKQLLLDSAGEGIYGVDSEGRLCFANAFTVNRLGWGESELVGSNMHKLSHHTRANGEPYPPEECPVHSTLMQGTAHRVSDDIFWCKDGSNFPVEYTTTPIIEDGEQIGAVVVFRDVTQHRQTEEALRRTQKMDALGKLTGGIAHDFNNMLGVILGYSDLLLHRVDNDPNLENYAKQIQHAGERAKMLTAKLLAFSRKDTVYAEPSDINQLLLDSRHMLEKTLTARIEFVLELADDLWPVWLDKASLEDAILNMSINAMHAIPESGSLTLATSNIHLESDQLQQMDIGAGEYVLLTVTDTGIGMDQETQQRIFDPFFSTKGERGTGLGMSQVYGFVQQSGGAIHLDSELGHGSRFTFYFPRHHHTEVPGTADKGAVLGERPSGHETVLVVDDEAALRELAEETLTTHGYRVLCAETGEKALEILETESVDLLLSDVIMPRMDGYQLAEEVEKNYPQVKIQMASGFDDKRYVGKNEALHQRRLQKPFSSETLLQRIRELMDEDEIVSELELMHPIEWSEEISTGIAQVDDDHKILVSLINRCISAVGSIEQDEEIGTILGELLDYTNYHFRREEAVMDACHYPNLRAHKQTHQLMVDSVNQRIKEFRSRELGAELLLEFLRNWLIKHIIAEDRDIISYCQGNESLIEQTLRDAALNHSADD